MYKTVLVFALLFLGVAPMANAANVTIRWDHNDPIPEGYRVFAREKGKSYDYSQPIWQGSVNTCVLNNIAEGVTYYFVVRAYEGSQESVDSEEVSYNTDNNGPSGVVNLRSVPQQ